MHDPALMEVLDRLRNRYFGKYRGSVTQVDTSTLRIKAQVPAVLADQETGWCAHCLPFAGDSLGLAFLPEVGSGVWIEFEGGDVSYPIFTGCYWRTGEAPSDAAPEVRAIVTKSHKILLDDDQGSITISDSNNNSITLDSNGITLTGGSSSVAISDSEVNVNDGALEVM